jgi:SAM-dependent methyltransferase
MAGKELPAELFDDDYLYFYEEILGDERSDADAALAARLLSLGAGMRVLDVPCGEGRIAGRLAALGCDVVGVDNNEPFLELARARHPGPEYRVGDMRELAYEAEFDAVVNWFTSFGYFDPATNDAVLAAFARALRPGGRLLLDVYNPARLRRLVDLAGGQTALAVDRGDDLIVDRVSIDDEQGRGHTERFLVRDGRVRKLEFSIELVEAETLTDRLSGAGFADVELFGAGGGAFDPEGPRLIALARR